MATPPFAGDREHHDRTYLLAEPQREMLVRARRKPPFHGMEEIGRVQADGVALPFRDGSADLVRSLGVLCCTAPAAVPRAIREIERVLRPGGRLAFAVPRRHIALIEPLLLAEGLEPIERFGRNRILFKKG
ncbi:Methyltransferase type 11 domain protein [mine drainage metagenome]|uniref:Methyltransferase type 11 domain protein n=1 Tax=mine drainage metagenome TaxID=410659 RepID=T0YS34_9ZZZZ